MRCKHLVKRNCLHTKCCGGIGKLDVTLRLRPTRLVADDAEIALMRGHRDQPGIRGIIVKKFRLCRFKITALGIIRPLTQL